MKISYLWLKQFIPDLKASPQRIAEALSFSLAEVETIKGVGDDYILEIDNKALTHRPDCFGHWGIAREVAAALDLKLKIPAFLKLQVSSFKFQASSFKLQIQIEDSRLCPRYTAVILNRLKVGPSPNWLKTALERLGIRSINNVVDITNYVMLELGQPLHAFDLKKLKTKTAKTQIIVKRAKIGEMLTTLDGVERKLDKSMLTINDEKGPIALAGIMGGKTTEVDEKTTAVVLESANFEPTNNRKASRHLGLRTEASLRFEKGLDPNLTKPALLEAVRLLAQEAGAQIASPIADFYPAPRRPKILKCDLKQLHDFIGDKLAYNEIKKIFAGLGIQIKEKRGSLVTLQIPTFRSDLSLPADLTEEIARIHNYNKITPTLPARPIKAPLRSREFEFETKIKNNLAGLGFNEVYSYSFVGEKLLTACRLKTENLVRLQNPLSPELEFLRPELISGLMEKVKLNSKNFDEVRLFEIGKITLPSSHSPRDELPSEPKKIAAIIYRQIGKIGKTSQPPLFYLLKGMLEQLFLGLGLPEVDWQPSFGQTYGGLFDPAKTAIIKSSYFGLIGEIHPLVLRNFGLEPNSTAAFELDPKTLLKQAAAKQFQSIPVFPPIKYDLSLAVDKKVTVREIVEAVKKTGGKLLVEIMPFDIYEDIKTLGLGKKSIALHLTFQSLQKQLSQNETSPILKKIKKTLIKTFSTTIR